MTMEETKRCPYCGEEILAVARKCKHCGEWLDREEPKTEKKMIECPVCGEDVEEGTDICPYCNEPVAGAGRIRKPQEDYDMPRGHSAASPKPSANVRVNGGMEDTDDGSNGGVEESGLFRYYYADVFFSHYADFSGSLSRKRFWIACLFNMLVAMPIACIDFALFDFFMPFYSLYALALFVPGLACNIRRLHDTGKSGWNMLWALLPIAGPIILLVMLCKKGVQQTGRPRAVTADYVLFGAIGVATVLFLSIGFATIGDKVKEIQRLIGGISAVEGESDDAEIGEVKNYATLYDLFTDTSAAETDYCDFELPVWRDNLIPLVGEDNYNFMCEMDMVSSLDKGNFDMGRVDVFTFGGWKKGSSDDGYEISYCYYGMEDPEYGVLGVKITRNGVEKIFSNR